MFAISLAVMVFIAIRIALVEFPTFSPLMGMNFDLYSPIQLIAAAILIGIVATVVARRWSEPPRNQYQDLKISWRHNEERYFHEQFLFILPLGCVALAFYIVCGRDMYGWSRGDSISSLLFLFAFPGISFSIILVLLASQIAIARCWKKQPETLAFEPPRLSPGLFALVWFTVVLIVLCSAPIFGIWHIVSFLRAGYY
jgi:hypothetical protein